MYKIIYHRVLSARDVRRGTRIIIIIFASHHQKCHFWSFLGPCLLCLRGE